MQTLINTASGSGVLDSVDNSGAENNYWERFGRRLLGPFPRKAGHVSGLRFNICEDRPGSRRIAEVLTIRQKLVLI